MPSPEKIQLNIRDEVEARFEHPPKAFADLVEAEVEKRVKKVERFYVIIFVIVGLFAIFWWKKTLNEIPQSVQEQLRQDSSIEAKKQISEILVYAQGVSNVLANFSSNRRGPVLCFHVWLSWHHHTVPPLFLPRMNIR